jgi:F0F1-type ATP synthase membrane subunit a
MEGFLPRVVFTVFGVPIRDTVVATWAMMILLLGAAVIINRVKPTALEMLVDFLNDLISGIIGRTAMPFLALLGSLAIFIAAANVIGIVPFLISPTRDLNTPLALSLVVFLSVHYFGIRSKGMARYIKRGTDAGHRLRAGAAVPAVAAGRPGNLHRPAASVHLHHPGGGVYRSRNGNRHSGKWKGERVGLWQRWIRTP